MSCGLEANALNTVKAKAPPACGGAFFHLPVFLKIFLLFAAACATSLRVSRRFGTLHEIGNVVLLQTGPAG
jgi:hypothetical protein